MTLDVRMLGPLEVRVDGRPVTVPRGNATTVLALLLDDANRVVPIGGLVAAVYGDELPLDPETQVQNTVGVLRRQLGAARDRIETVGRAYRFRIEAAELDTLRCKAKEDEARELRRVGELEPAAAALREALAEWRGPALADLPGHAVAAIGRRLDEYRLALLEQRIDIDIEMGKGPNVIDELRQIVDVHDTRQRFVALLMRALHSAGRAAEALEAFARLKDRLADALGADPNRELVELHTAILRDDPGPEAASVALPESAPRYAPAMLPRATARFTGRESEIDALDGLLAASEAEAGLAVVTGMGGVGKTALAVRWAHRVAHRFPDGQLYFNLHGFDPVSPGVDPGTVLGEALVALGIEAHRLPAGLDERAGLYRTVLAQRRILVVLDNAGDAAQVRPLLPVSEQSFTLVTSRDRLVGLDMSEGAEVVRLNLMSEEDATALFTRRVGPSRAATEERPVRRIVASCGRLPLALTLIGAWAAANPDLSLAALADRLESTKNVLNVLVARDLSSDPRSVFACSYQALGGRTARAFRMFGLHPGPELTAAALASMTGMEAADARSALAELAEVHLVEEPSPGRYAMHDLLRGYAAERFAAEVDEAERHAATRRMLEHYVYTVDKADELLVTYRDRLDLGMPTPGVHPEQVDGPREAFNWVRDEYQVLRELLRLEPGPGLDVRIWQLAWCMAEFMMERYLGQDLRDSQTAALAAAERAGDVFAQIVSLGYLGASYYLLGDDATGREYTERALARAEEHQRPWAKGFVCYAMAVFAGREERDREALEYGLQALEHFRASGDRFWEYRTVYCVGWHHTRLDHYDEARACFQDLMAVSEETGIRLGVASAHLGFGHLAAREGRCDEALGHYAKAQALYGEYGLEPSEAFASELAGDVENDLGDQVGACARWKAAERTYGEFGAVIEIERVRAKLAACPAC